MHILFRLECHIAVYHCEVVGARPAVLPCLPLVPLSCLVPYMLLPISQFYHIINSGQFTAVILCYNEMYLILLEVQGISQELP